MSIDLRSLIEPLSARAPSGPNLEYTPEFAALERAALGTREQTMGSAVLPGEPPDPALVLRLATELLGQTRDLRIGVHLLRATLARSGIGAFAEGLGLVHGWLESNWQDLHPAPEEDEPDDFGARCNAVAALAAPELLLALRTTPLYESKVFGPISAHDIGLALGEASGPGEKPRVSMPQLGASLREQGPARVAEIEQLLHGARARAQGIMLSFQSRSAVGPDLSALVAFFQRSAAALAGLARPDAEPRFEAPGALPAGIENTSAATTARADGEPWLIRGRQDVVRALDRVREYYDAHEPSSPVPLLLERCQRLATLGFMGIVKDLAPDALGKLETTLGAKAK
jgi:type VI secretion system protein ImpA